MSGRIRFLTAGESHGPALVGIIEGIPSRMSLVAEDIHVDLRRRKLGYGRGSRQKMEEDQVRILSGVRLGETLGSPITLMIENRDWKNWTEIMKVEPGVNTSRVLEVPRPGHADYLGGIKYQHEDMRNVLERASARETTIRVALGAVAKKFLSQFNIKVVSRVTEVGSVKDMSIPTQWEDINTTVDSRFLRMWSEEADLKARDQVEEARKSGDTLGGVFEVVATGLPLALGSYVQWDRRMEAQIGAQFLSLNAIKGVEIGNGFELGRVPGSQAHDEFFPDSKSKSRIYRKTNRSGGLDGGMTTGEPLIVRAAMKPIATLMKALSSVDLKSGESKPAHVERSDTCAVAAAAVIGESLLAFVLAESILEKFGGDSVPEILERWSKWVKK